MPDSVTGIADYRPPPDPETAGRRARLLWLAAAVSILMTAGGYFLVVYLLLK